MTLVFEFKYNPEVHKDRVFTSADRTTLYTRPSKTHEFTCYQTGDHSSTIFVSFEEYGFWVEYDLTELPVLCTDAALLPPYVYRSDTMIYAKHVQVPFEDLDDTMYITIDDECFNVPISEIPLR